MLASEQKGKVKHICKHHESLRLEGYMVKPLEFGDFYKFIASFGLALLVFACILPWTVLRDPLSLNLKEKEISELTQTAQRIVAQRQQYADTLTFIVPQFAVLLALAGIVLMGYGIKGWYSRQKFLDEEQWLKNSKLAEDIGKDAANVLLSEFLKQFRQLTQEQVRLLFMFVRLHKQNEEFVIPDTSSIDPERENRIHNDLRYLREAFLLTAFDSAEKKPSGRFRHPRIVMLRPWALKLATYVHENPAKKDLEISEGRKWFDIQQEVYHMPIQSIKDDLTKEFNKNYFSI